MDAPAKNETIHYEIRRRRVRYPRLELKTGTPVLILPEDYPDPSALLKRHEGWLREKTALIRESITASGELKLNRTRTLEELKLLAQEWVEECRKRYGFEPGRLFFRRMTSKWGSCSARGNLTLNTRLRYLPEKLIRYVIFHELIHLRERRHNTVFWSLVSQEFPDHQRLEGELFAFHFLISREGL